MPRGYRYIVLAALGWLILANSPPKEPGPPHHTNTEEAAPAQAAPSPSAKPYRPYPSIHDPRCYQDSDHDTADLCAQWRAAIAAEKAATLARWGDIIAGVGALLSFIGILLVLAALKQGRDAHVLAEDTAKRQLRAYIGIKDGGVKIETSTQMSAVVSVINAGQTPAYKFRSAIDAFVRPVGHHIAIGPPHDDIVAIELGPGQGSTLVAPIDLSREEVSDVAAGKADVFVLISCEFEDAFAIPHRYKACLKRHGATGLGPYPYEDAQ